MTLTLYHNSMSTCSQKVRLALAEKNVEDWESRELDLRGGDQFDPDYAKLNPNRVVPTLVHGNGVVIESNVINEYIADAFDGLDLRPKDPLQTAAMRLWTKQLDEGVHAATGTLSFTVAFRHQLLAKPPEVLEFVMSSMSEPRRKGMQAMLDLGPDVPGFPGAVQRFERLLGDMETALSQHTWLAGDEYSLADIAYAPYLTRLEHLAFAPWWDQRPKLAAWWEAVKARPGYAIAVEAWNDPAYLELMQEKGTDVWPRIAAIIH